MKNIKRNLLKIVVLIALFAPAAFADDGDMGGGGFAGTVSTSKAGKVVIAQGTDEDGDMGGGGKTKDPGYADLLMSAIYEYLDLMI
jgi:hypothetical protein